MDHSHSFLASEQSWLLEASSQFQWTTLLHLQEILPDLSPEVSISKYLPSELIVILMWIPVLQSLSPTEFNSRWRPHWSVEYCKGLRPMPPAGVWQCFAWPSCLWEGFSTVAYDCPDSSEHISLLKISSLLHALTGCLLFQILPQSLSAEWVRLAEWFQLNFKSFPPDGNPAGTTVLLLCHRWSSMSSLKWSIYMYSLISLLLGSWCLLFPSDVLGHEVHPRCPCWLLGAWFILDSFG